MRAFLELVYSFAKQYIAWYDRSIKGKATGISIQIREK